MNGPQGNFHISHIHPLVRQVSKMRSMEVRKGGRLLMWLNTALVGHHNNTVHISIPPEFFIVPSIFSSVTGFSSQMGTKLCDWDAWQAGAGCYSQAALSSNESNTQYFIFIL